MNKELITKLCQVCAYSPACGFISRDLQNDCPTVQQSFSGYDLGYEDAIKKACDWLVDNAHHYHDINGDLDVFEMVEQLKNAMLYDT